MSFRVPRIPAEIVAFSGGASRQEVGGTKGDRGSGGGAPGKIFGTTPFLILGNALFPTGNAHVYSRGNAFQLQVNTKEQRDSQDLGISDDKCCKHSNVC